MEIIKSINERYSSLADKKCCLSCGGAINFADIKSGDICIDIGSGRGNDVIRMAEMTGESGYVYGIDISDGMIEKAKTLIEKFEVKNAEIIKSELEDIKLESSIADIIISNCTLNHSLNPEKVWKEIYRILKSGAKFVVSDIYSEADVPYEYRNDPVAVSECWAGAIKREKYLTILEKTGFKNIQILEESKPYEKGKIRVSSWTITGMK